MKSRTLIVGLVLVMTSIAQASEDEYILHEAAGALTGHATIRRTPELVETTKELYAEVQQCCSTVSNSFAHDTQGFGPWPTSARWADATGWVIFDSPGPGDAYDLQLKAQAETACNDTPGIIEGEALVIAFQQATFEVVGWQKKFRIKTHSEYDTDYSVIGWGYSLVRIDGHNIEVVLSESFTEDRTLANPGITTTEQQYVLGAVHEGLYRAQCWVIAKSLPVETISNHSSGFVLSEMSISFDDIGISASTDVDGDGHVTASDLSYVLSSWGTADEQTDFNQDGIVNGEDLGLLLSAWTG